MSTDLVNHNKKIADAWNNALNPEIKYYWRTMNGLWLVRDGLTGMVTTDASVGKAIKLSEIEAKNTDFDFKKLTFYDNKPGK
ncbi:hypothetical protein [Fructobacillus cardui]|uniref:Uncharacterized protein n=1 Tax=Fructobacillus cardui TaxID=2893170 RepID=A0ABM9N278_9LACO|nr:unnamed protein product [Fructobacillus cardui]